MCLRNLFYNIGSSKSVYLAFLYTLMTIKGTAFIETFFSPFTLSVVL